MTYSFAQWLIHPFTQSPNDSFIRLVTASITRGLIGMRLPAGSARGTVDYFDNIAFHLFSKKITNAIGVIAF